MFQRRHIFLIGLSGSGKSTIGKILGKKLNRPFVDIDELIVKKKKKSIAKIFESEGEATFRKIEAQTIRQIVNTKSRPLVITLGGGAMQSAKTRKLIRGNGISVWLKCSLSELSRRLMNKTDRPLLMNGRTNNSLTKSEMTKRLNQLLRDRIRNYKLADLQLSATSASPSRIAIKIITKLRQSYAQD